MSGGVIESIFSFLSDSTITVTGGRIEGSSFLFIQSMNMTGGLFEDFRLDDGIMTLDGGAITNPTLEDEFSFLGTTLRLRGGRVSGRFMVRGSSTVDLRVQAVLLDGQQLPLRSDAATLIPARDGNHLEVVLADGERFTATLNSDPSVTGTDFFSLDSQILATLEAGANGADLAEPFGVFDSFDYAEALALLPSAAEFAAFEQEFNAVPRE